MYIGGNVRLFGDLACVEHFQFLKLELDGTDVGTRLDFFIIISCCRNLSNFMIRTI